MLPIRILRSQRLPRELKESLRHFGGWGIEGAPKGTPECLAKKSEEVYRKEPGAFPPGAGGLAPAPARIRARPPSRATKEGVRAGQRGTTSRIR